MRVPLGDGLNSKVNSSRSTGKTMLVVPPATDSPDLKSKIVLAQFEAALACVVRVIVESTGLGAGSSHNQGLRDFNFDFASALSFSWAMNSTRSLRLLGGKEL